MSAHPWDLARILRTFTGHFRTLPQNKIIIIISHSQCEHYKKTMWLVRKGECTDGCCEKGGKVQWWKDRMNKYCAYTCTGVGKDIWNYPVTKWRITRVQHNSSRCEELRKPGTILTGYHHNKGGNSCEDQRNRWRNGNSGRFWYGNWYQSIAGKEVKGCAKSCGLCTGRWFSADELWE